MDFAQHTDVPQTCQCTLEYVLCAQPAQQREESHRPGLQEAKQSCPFSPRPGDRLTLAHQLLHSLLRCVRLLVPPAGEEGHLHVDKPAAGLCLQGSEHRVQDILHT